MMELHQVAASTAQLDSIEARYLARIQKAQATLLGAQFTREARNIRADRDDKLLAMRRAFEESIRPGMETTALAFEHEMLLASVVAIPESKRLALTYALERVKTCAELARLYTCAIAAGDHGSMTFLEHAANDAELQRRLDSTPEEWQALRATVAIQREQQVAGIVKNRDELRAAVESLGRELQRRVTSQEAVDAGADPDVLRL